MHLVCVQLELKDQRGASIGFLSLRVKLDYPADSTLRQAKHATTQQEAPTAKSEMFLDLLESVYTTGSILNDEKKKTKNLLCLD